MYKTIFNDYRKAEKIILLLFLFLAIVVTATGIINLINGNSSKYSAVMLLIVLFTALIFMTYMYFIKKKIIKCIAGNFKPIIELNNEDVILNNSIIKLNDKYYYACKIDRDIYKNVSLFKTHYKPQFIIEVKYYKIIVRLFYKLPDAFNNLISDNKISIKN